MISSNAHILYVDDDKDSSELIKFMLHHAYGNYNVTTVPTPDEALALISQKGFDLYIVDYRFTNMTGVELCRQIRKTDEQTPILFFTGMARPADRDCAIAAGANAYLIKPNDLERLPETVNQMLDGQLAIAHSETPTYAYSDT
jgi:CheY-like chemotaxis protein